MIQSSQKKMPSLSPKSHHLFEPEKNMAPQTDQTDHKTRPPTVPCFDPEKPFDPRHSAKSEGLRRVSKTSGGRRRDGISRQKNGWRIFCWFRWFFFRYATLYVTIVYLGSIVYFALFGGVCCFVCMFVLVHIRSLVWIYLDEIMNSTKKLPNIPKETHISLRIINHPIPSMVMVYLPTWKPWKSTIHVGKYTSPMDGMGIV